MDVGSTNASMEHSSRQDAMMPSHPHHLPMPFSTSLWFGRTSGKDINKNDVFDEGYGVLQLNANPGFANSRSSRCPS